jgi:AcrR family transcriptional regulator
MANSYSQTDERRLVRRQRTVDLALKHAIAIMTERGVGGLTVSEVARRMAVQPPSLYKYFDSLHAMYDQLFALGLTEYWNAVSGAVAADVGWERRLRAAVRASVEWSVTHPALAQLMFWRPVPDFTPSPQTFAASAEQMALTRNELAAAVAHGELAAGTDLDEALRMLTVVVSGLISQQMANQPGASYAEGVFSQLTNHAVDMYLGHYRSGAAGQSNQEASHANP